MTNKQINNYAFYYANTDTIYMQVGFDSFEDAKSKLAQIAEIFPNKNASGRVDEINKGEIKNQKEYDISYRDDRISLRLKK